MHFWGSDTNKFGKRWSKGDTNLVKLYEKVYVDFNLTPPNHVKENARVPVVVESGFDGKPFSFEVRGRHLSPQNLMAHGYGNVFHTISREMPVPKNRVWAYDITRLREGILTGVAVFDKDVAFSRSEEYLKILRIIGDSAMKCFTKVPAIHLDFGYTWEHFGVPDRVSVSLDSKHPFEDDEFLKLINTIIRSYRSYHSHADYSYSADPATGTLEITVSTESAISASFSPVDTTAHSEGISAGS